MLYMSGSKYITVTNLLKLPFRAVYPYGTIISVRKSVRDLTSCVVTARIKAVHFLLSELLQVLKYNCLNSFHTQN